MITNDQRTKKISSTQKLNTVIVCLYVFCLGNKTDNSPSFLSGKRRKMVPLESIVLLDT